MIGQNNETAAAKKRILILGAGIMQLPAIRIAKAKGWYVAVADGSDEAPGISLADRFFHVDLKAWEAMTDAAEVMRQEGGIDGVFTAGTDFSLTVARVAEKLTLPGISVEAAMAASDKALMRRTLSNANVRVPRFVQLAGGEKKLSKELSYPLVVKPVDNMGARGVRRVDNDEELSSALDDAFRFSRSGSVIVEEFLDGPEFSIDALVEKGQVRFCGIADRHITFAPYFVEMGHTIPSSASADMIEEVKREFLKAVAAIGIDNGAAKGDVKFCRGKAWIGEVAARLSGGFMSGWSYPLSSGVEPTDGALNIAVGLPANLPSPVRNHTCAERGFISVPGVVASVESLGKARAIKSVKEIFVLIKPGSEVNFPVNNVQKCGNVLASADRREQAVSAAQDGAGRVLVRLVPGEKRTGAFLFGKKEAWIPDAYTLSCEENRAALSRLESIYGVDKRPSSPLSDSITLVSLPILRNEVAVDWHGLGLREGFDRLLALTGVSAVDPQKWRMSGQEGLLLGSLFWRAFLRGGVQGGVWIIDTVRSWRERDIDYRRELQIWENA